MKRLSISYHTLYLTLYIAFAFLWKAVPLRSEVVRAQEVYRKSFEGAPQDLWWIGSNQGALTFLYHDTHNQAFTIDINNVIDDNRKTITLTNKDLIGRATKAPLVYTKTLPTSASANQKIAYSVSKSGAMIAWAWGQTLRLASLQGRRLHPLGTGETRAETVSRIVFLQEENPLIGLLFEDGKFEVWGGTPFEKKRPGSWFDSVWSIWTHGNPFLVASLESRDLGIIQLSQRGKNLTLDARFFIAPTDFSSAAFSPTGRIALGTSGGVALVQADEHQLVQFSQHPTQALTFASEDDFWAADTAGDLYFSTMGTAHKVTAEKFPILRIAANSQRIAYTTKKEIVVMNLRKAGRAEILLQKYQVLVIAVAVLGILTFLVALRMRPRH